MPTREHIFKAKRLDNGEWVEGYLTQDTICSFHGTYLAMTIHEIPQGIYDGMYHEVIPETVCEYTGLTDKNGTKIFEGDIMQLCSGTYPCLVYWDDRGFSWLQNNKRREIDLTRGKMSIIGNIYDNPELLEVKE